MIRSVAFELTKRASSSSVAAVAASMRATTRCAAVAATSAVVRGMSTSANNNNQQEQDKQQQNNEQSESTASKLTKPGFVAAAAVALVVWQLESRGERFGASVDGGHQSQEPRGLISSWVAKALGHSTVRANARLSEDSNVRALIAEAAMGKTGSRQFTSLMTTVCQHADRLYDGGHMDDLYAFLHATMAADSPLKSGAIAWRAARAARERSLATTDAELKKKLVYEAYELAKRAIEYDPSDFACHKWLGITISDVGEYEGVKVKISNAFTIKKHFDEAVRLNPDDPTSRHLVGMWCFTFADMPWYQRKIAATLFATPPSATYDEALGHFVAAENIEPGFYVKNTLMIGKVYLRMGQKEEAKKYLTKTIFQAKTEADRESLEEAKQILEKM
ncbi:microtubule-associated protein [Capsaspora owczarzaki ATCC 30864]|uniref:Regulator of microtubule dynamics protein 1 n=1 Tax=Capsaspora owczarzaki (strain ATCC 30864) TaxID=595528 RepID=A0A0D2WVP2_CAPO3|nr:microtubule-associated protein [Capsaspora owczarzaki ATCC 30864]KJE96333.1 microtubule-associated protein [Capsaspora owczarzaki ATCC 30864]|eukprot:XP_004344295.1 microtubule-associated protein [Capsaspora owczarzaki ATCC 30864]